MRRLRVKRSRRPVHKPGRIPVWTFGGLVAAYERGSRRFQLMRTMHIDRPAVIEHCVFYIGATMDAFVSGMFDSAHKVQFSFVTFDGQNGRNGRVKYGFQTLGAPPEPDPSL